MEAIVLFGYHLKERDLLLCVCFLLVWVCTSETIVFQYRIFRYDTYRKSPLDILKMNEWIIN